MIIGWNNLPITPTGGFKIFVNSGVSTTTNRIVNLNFNAGADIKKMAISLTGDFNDASQENYSPTKQIDLCQNLRDKKTRLVQTENIQSILNFILSPVSLLWLRRVV